MVGLGTIFIAILFLAAIQMFRKRLYNTKWLLWSLMLMLPMPYIANTTGWYTAELGRQPWLVYNLLRTSDGASPVVSSGNTLFTLLGFIGLYLLLGILFLLLAGKIINKGPKLIKS